MDNYHYLYMLTIVLPVPMPFQYSKDNIFNPVQNPA